MEIENRWLESTLDSTMSRDERRQLSVGFVSLVLGKMTKHGIIKQYSPIDKDNYHKSACSFTPEFSISYMRDKFNLFVAVDREEFVQMGQILSYDSAVLRIFDGDRVMDPGDIIPLLERKLERAQIVRRKVKMLLESIKDS